ncbi:LAMI_0D07360g1_1 [Lachancea mirantina]|uniref:LAMI_0D07360g1_1 n=1 Tax=Lachancea mirantina TaxID=1230905 RepID=A0A1G4JCZ3_9SACH|nr:LAMI_0D07360g1_1 [Lachancea mirantina]
MTSKLIPIKDQAALVLEDGKIYKIQRRRQRKILSCVPCHQRKIKCSREQPACQNCTKNHWSCSYFLNDRVSRGKSSPAVAADLPSPQLRENSAPPAGDSKQQLLMAIEKAKTMVQDEKTLLELRKQHKRRYAHRKKAADAAYGRFPRDPATALSSPQSSSTETLDCASSCAPTPAFSPLVTGSPDQKSPDESVSRDLGVSPDHGVTFSLRDILLYLPSRARSEELCDVYRNTVHPIIPLFNVEQLVADHALFWAGLEAGPPTGSPATKEFLQLLFPVLYAATKSEFHRRSNSSELYDEMASYHEASDLLYAMNDFPNRYTLQSLAGFVLINSIIENPNITTIAQLSRLAQRAMLTRDPVSHHKITDYAAVQSRRTLFWQIFQLDTMTSLHNNLPPLLKLEEFDTALPSEVSGGVLDPSLCFLNAKYRFVVLLNELCSQSSRGVIQGIKERIVDLHACCMGSALSLTNYSKQNFPRSPLEAKFIEWAVFMLNTFADRACLLLHLNIIKTSLPMLMRRRKFWRRTLNAEDEASEDLIAKSGYGLHFLAIQAILNDSGNLALDHHLMGGLETPVPGKLVYNYEDLTNNLIPASLHYLDEFLKYHGDDTYSCYNWELLVGNMPINAITFVLKTLALDLNRAQRIGQVLILQHDLRYILLSKAIPVAEAKIDSDTAICRNCFQLVKLLFNLIIVKFDTSKNVLDAATVPGVKLYAGKYDVGSLVMQNNRASVVPQPSIDLRAVGSDTSHSGPNMTAKTEVWTGRDASSILSITSIINSGHLFTSNFNLSDNSLLQNAIRADNADTTSCALVAPKIMRELSCSFYNNSESTEPAESAGSLAVADMLLRSEPTESPGELDYLSSFKRALAKKSNTASISAASTKAQIQDIRQDVQRYILLLNADADEAETIGTGDEYYREFENALLEIICGILASDEK